MSGSSTSQDTKIGLNKPTVTTRRGRSTTTATQSDEFQPAPNYLVQGGLVPLKSGAAAEAVAGPGRLREELQRSNEEMEKKLAQFRARCDLIKRDYEHQNYEDQQLRLFSERVRTTREQLKKEEAEIAQHKEYVKAQRRKHSMEYREVDSLRAEHKAPRVD